MDCSDSSKSLDTDCSIGSELVVASGLVIGSVGADGITVIFLGFLLDSVFLLDPGGFLF